VLGEALDGMTGCGRSLLEPLLSDPIQSPCPRLSVIVPVFEEAGNLPQLHEELLGTLSDLEGGFELLYVDDGSRDGSREVLRALRRGDRRVRVICLRYRAGQTAALAAGFELARGEVLVPLDGDLQNDPADIPMMVARLDDGFDVVTGWRKDRRDAWFFRRIPSIIANWLISTITGVDVHDTGCTLKAFRSELMEGRPLYGEQHRYLPALFAGSGARVTELIVNHRPRLHGDSKYGIGRTLRVLLDMLSVTMISSFSQRPLRYFVFLALPFFAASVLVGVTAPTELLGGDSEFGLDTLAVLAFMLPFMACAYFVLLGLLAELVVKATDVHRANALGVQEGAAR
jgi:glycosyltransferase involved in cell wall biosynthesis